MNLDPQTTERLIGMVSSKDKGDRTLAYGILHEYFTHIMFSFRRNIGYLLLIHKNAYSWDDADDDQVTFSRMMESHAPSKSGFYSYSDIITITDSSVKQSDQDQRRMVYEHACRSMRETLKINE
jgi:hypothetical protein